MDKDVALTLCTDLESAANWILIFEAKQGYCALVDKFAPGWRSPVGRVLTELALCTSHL